MADIQELPSKLKEMRAEHRALDEEIAGLHSEQKSDLLLIQRLKKRKLQLKDDITRIESKLLPDIIA